MSTLPDPRTRALSPSEDIREVSGSPSPSPSPALPQHPDLSDEVATLSTKLINAINHQTVLDDTISATRHELESANGHIRELEAQLASQREMMSGDVWVRRSTLDTERKAMQAEKRTMQSRVAEEAAKRVETEKDKRKIEQELENLTTALFEEANRMVIGAKEEAKAQHDALQRKNDQLKSQLADSESLLKSQQEQLSELKQVMEFMVIERDDQTSATAPSSPGISKFESKEDMRSLPDGFTAPSAFNFTDSPVPAPPTSFSHLVQPVLRNDLASYDDFLILARLSRKRTGSRVSSGSLGGLPSLSLGLGGSTSSAHLTNSSTPSLAMSSGAATASAPQSPNTPASMTSNSSNNASGLPIPNLKDTRFFKRIMTEDVDPTLRLDAAPGLSWLARRTVLSSIIDGSLFVEPVPMGSTTSTIAKPQFSPCSLCGESRRDTTYLRTHRFRTSETDSAQRYPLCSYCLGRVRSTCDFLGFLRMVKDGHWRADDEDHEKAAWEESVRLRESMFWSRIGGGVVPVNLAESMGDARSRRPSQDQVDSTESGSADKNIASVVDTALSGEEDDDDENHDGPLKRKTPVAEPYTPPEQTEGGISLRNSKFALAVDTFSNKGTEGTHGLSITTQN